MTRGPTDAVPQSLLDVAAEVGAGAHLFLPDARESFASTVRAVDEDSILLASVRPDHGNLVLERVRLGLRLELTVAGVPVSGTTQVLDVGPEGVRVSIPLRLAKVQRRRYFRVPVPEGTEVHLQVGDDARCRTLVDLSCIGGAFRAHASDVDLVPGQGIDLFQFALPAGRTFVASATVKQRAVRGSGWSAERIVGVEFEGVAHRDRERLLAWIQERERAELRERVREPARPLADGLLVVKGPGNRTRLRAVLEAGSRTLTIALTGDDGDIIRGVKFSEIELRMAGSAVLRAPMTVERVRDADRGQEATLGFGELRGDEARKYLSVLRSSQGP